MQAAKSAGSWYLRPPAHETQCGGGASPIGALAPGLPMSNPQGVTELLAAMRDGQDGSFERLFEVVHDETSCRRAHFQLGASSHDRHTTGLRSMRPI